MNNGILKRTLIESPIHTCIITDGQYNRNDKDREDNRNPLSLKTNNNLMEKHEERHYIALNIRAEISSKVDKTFRHKINLKTYQKKLQASLISLIKPQLIKRMEEKMG